MKLRLFSAALVFFSVLAIQGCENSSPDFPQTFKLEVEIPEIPLEPVLACVEALNKYISFAKSNCCDGEATFEFNHEPGSVSLDCEAPAEG